jgi:hypothetical protein
MISRSSWPSNNMLIGDSFGILSPDDPRVRGEIKITFSDWILPHYAENVALWRDLNARCAQEVLDLLMIRSNCEWLPKVITATTLDLGEREAASTGTMLLTTKRERGVD